MAEEALLGTMPDEDLVKKLNRSLIAIKSRRFRQHIPAFAGPRAWTAEDEALLGKFTDKEIARRFNRTLDAVAIRRQRLRIPAFGYRGRRWTAKENKLLRTMPDEDVAAKLGRTPASVRLHRKYQESSYRRKTQRMTVGQDCSGRPC